MNIEFILTCGNFSSSPVNVTLSETEKTVLHLPFPSDQLEKCRKGEHIRRLSIRIKTDYDYEQSIDNSGNRLTLHFPVTLIDIIYTTVDTHRLFYWPDLALQEVFTEETVKNINKIDYVSEEISKESLRANYKRTVVHGKERWLPKDIMLAYTILESHKEWLNAGKDEEEFWSRFYRTINQQELREEYEKNGLIVFEEPSYTYRRVIKFTFPPKPKDGLIKRRIDMWREYCFCCFAKQGQKVEECDNDCAEKQVEDNPQFAAEITLCSLGELVIINGPKK